MIRIVGLQSALEWDSIVRSFSRHDVYYLNGYVKAFQINGDGDPFLLYYEGAGSRAIYVYIRRKTALEGRYDSITPYGYGGVLFDSEVLYDELKVFWEEYKEIMLSQGIVDNFVRYHPILCNARPMRQVSDVVDLGKTVAMDLASHELIWENITSKNRNMIRKAEKNGVVIDHGKDYSLFTDFRQIYNSTMAKDHAEGYYFFGKEFYDSIYKDLDDNYELFFAKYDGKIIAMSIMLFCNHQMHYHLSGSLSEYRSLAPSNLLLYKAALWGCEQGFKTFHLGGGVGSSEDSLYKFKAAFNRHSGCQFSIGKEVFDQECYDELVCLRKVSDPDFDAESHFFPLYRA